MLANHLVRIGVLGDIRRFGSADGLRFPRRSRVVCRTARGLEIGEVLAPAESMGDTPEGVILRRVTVEDDLLQARLERNKQKAFRACQQLLSDRKLPAILVDVEHLFDGRSLFFYFLGETTAELEAITAELAEVYDAQAHIRRFAQTLTNGCGPHCGTEQAEGKGCGTGGCSTCAVASACGKS